MINLENILNENKFPDLTGDGKVTRADILKGRGVIPEKKLAEGKEEEATNYANKAYKWNKKGSTFPTPQLADLWRTVRQAYIDGGKDK
jgi:hypothetical protein